MLHAPTLEPRLTPALVAAYAIAIAVHALTVTLFAGSIVLAVSYPNPLTILLALLGIGLAVLMRPRLGSVPEGTAVSREQAPELYGLAAEIASQVQTSPPDLIVIDHEFNAYWSVVGIRRRRVLGLGLPLLVCMEPQARAGVVAHELGHARNGDVRRGIVVGSAVAALEALHDAIAGETPWSDDAVETLTAIIRTPLAAPVRWLLLLEVALLLRDSQRAEYLADARAARAVGTFAMVDTHALLLLAPSAMTIVHRRGVSSAGADGLLAELSHALLHATDDEREARREAARQEKSSLESTHPPMAQRIALLEARPVEPAKVWSDSARARRVDTELAPLGPQIERDMLDAYRGSLYSG